MSKSTNICNKPPLGKLIAVELESNNKTQRWLAKEIGLNHVYLCQVISGKAQPSLTMLKKVAVSLDIDIKDLTNALFCER